MTASLRTATGVTPWNLVNAFVKLSGESYPYFKAMSITFSSVVASSLPASASLRLRIYYETVKPQSMAKPFWK